MADRWRLVLARVLHAVVALAALTGVAIEVGRIVVEGAGDAPSTAERTVRLFSLFTVQSNLLVAGVGALLACRPAHDGNVFRLLHLDAVLCITVTGLVYWTVIAGSEAGDLSDLLLHVVAPCGAVLTWLLVGPRPRADRRTVGASIVLPLVWIAWTWLRGAWSGWYPYLFLDVGALGAAQAAANTALVAVVFVVLAWLFGILDRRLPTAPVRPGDDR